MVMIMYLRFRIFVRFYSSSVPLVKERCLCMQLVNVMYARRAIEQYPNFHSDWTSARLSVHNVPGSLCGAIFSSSSECQHDCLVF